MGELGQRLSHSEWVYWLAEHSLDPLGEERKDLRIGQLLAAYVNAHQPRGKPKKKPTDFILTRKPKPKFDGESFIRNAVKFAQRQKLAREQAKGDVIND